MEDLTLGDKLLDQKITGITPRSPRVLGSGYFNPETGTMEYPTSGGNRGWGGWRDWGSNFFGKGKDLGLNMDTFDLVKSGMELYGDWADRQRGQEIFDWNKQRALIADKYAKANLAQQGTLINNQYAALRNWQDANDPTGTRYTRPTDVATTI